MLVPSTGTASGWWRSRWRLARSSAALGEVRSFGVRGALGERAEDVVRLHVGDPEADVRERGVDGSRLGVDVHGRFPDPKAASRGTVALPEHALRLGDVPAVASRPRRERDGSLAASAIARGVTVAFGVVERQHRARHIADGAIGQRRVGLGGRERSTRRARHRTRDARAPRAGNATTARETRARRDALAQPTRGTRRRTHPRRTAQHRPNARDREK